MLNRTNKEKCMFQRNDMKSQNIKDTKDAIKAFGEEAGRAQRKSNSDWHHVFSQSLCTLLPCPPPPVTKSSTTGTVHCHLLLSQNWFLWLTTNETWQTWQGISKAKSNEVLQLLFWSWFTSSLSKARPRAGVLQRAQVSPDFQQSSQGLNLWVEKAPWKWIP